MRLDRFYTNKITGKTSSSFLDVIGDCVSLNHKVISENSPDLVETVFNEIESVPHLDTLPDSYSDLLKLNPKSNNMGWQSFLNAFCEEYINAVERSWSTDKFNLIYHSSGYDSLMLSLALKYLSSSKGSSWMGDYLFVCLEPEGSAFKSIMKHQGWPADKYLVYKDGCEFDRYYEEAFLDYYNVPTMVNGVSSRPINVKRLPTDILQREGIIPDNQNLRMWSNQFAEILNSKITDFDAYYSQFYYTRFSRFWSAVECDVVDVYLDHDLMKFMIESSVSEWTSRDQLRSEFILRHDKQGLRYKRWGWKEVYGMGFFTIPDQLLSQCRLDYESSWANKNIKSEVAPTNECMQPATFSWWFAWSFGALTNVLAAAGCEIKV